jgi:hypothetical protein
MSAHIFKFTLNWIVGIRCGSVVQVVANALIHEASMIHNIYRTPM